MFATVGHVFDNLEAPLNDVVEKVAVMMPFSRGTTRPKIVLRHFARRLDR